MKFRIELAFLMVVLSCIPAATAADQESKTGQHAEKFEKGSDTLDYLLYLPLDYNKESEKKWPLIVFLHGSGERGTNVKDVAKHGPPKIVEGKEFPLGGRFIVVSPQCPPKVWWQVNVLNGLLDEVMEKYHVDKDRVYLTGLSMGGFGTWAWAAHDPQRFAAIAPMCGGGDPKQADQLKSIPIWCFHGEIDKSVPIQKSEEMIEAVKQAGNKEVEFTRYPDAGHDCWTRSYANPDLYEWFLKHKRN
jgi:predicted peptidase